MEPIGGVIEGPYPILHSLRIMQQTLQEQGVTPEAVLLSQAVYAQLQYDGAPLVAPTAAAPTPQLLGMRLYVSMAIPQDTIYMADHATIQGLLQRLSDTGSAE